MEILELIELYTKGLLPEEEKLAFERKLEEDPELSKTVENSVLVEKLVVLHSAMLLKNQMKKDLHQSWFRKYKLYLISAAILISGSMLILNLFNKSGIEKYENKIQENTSFFVPEKPHIKAPLSSEEEKPKIIPAEKGNRNFMPQVTEKTQPATISAQQPTNPQAAVHASSDSEKTKIITEPTVTDAPVIAKQKEDPCLHFTGSADLQTTPSCFDHPTGTVQILTGTIKGGTPPYLFHLGKKTSTGFFDHIASGSYKIEIEDANHCRIIILQEAFIPSYSCKVNKQYVFNPDMDGVWIIPYDHQKEPKLFRVLDKSGKIFYQSNITGFSPGEWKGESSTGMNIDPGILLFDIEYTDGSLDEGAITISR